MKVVVSGTRDGRLTAGIRLLARRLNRDFGSPRIDVTVIFVNDRYIHDLNLRYRKRDRPTDVLSFLLPADSCQLSAPVGEVYVSRDTARAQAREYAVPYASEVHRLVLHGLLHVLALTHRQMEPLYARYLGRD
jgi:probable rRNA maturation factor